MSEESRTVLGEVSNVLSGAFKESTVEVPHPFHQVSLPDNLEKLREIVETVRQRAINWRDWYDKNASRQAWKSRTLRWLSVFLVVSGGLCPLVPASVLPAILGEAALQPYGYLLLAAAAGVVVFDRAFGYSSSWMRYRIAHMRIDRALSLYGVVAQTIMAGTESQNSSKSSNIRALIAASHNFLSTIEDLVVEETEDWLHEFKAEHVRFQDQVGKQNEVN